MTASNVLMELLKKPDEALELSRHTGTILADWLEEAMMSSSRQRSGEIHDAIVELFQSSLLKCSVNVRSVLLAKSTADVELKESYNMGVLSLAQLIAAQNLDRKAGSDFNECLQDKANTAYLKALCIEPRTNKALSKEVGQTEENVSRKLKRFRELGVVSSKKMGTNVINSLTAAARDTLEELGLLKEFLSEHTGKPKSAAIIAFESIRQSASPYMQDQPGFSRSERATA